MNTIAKGDFEISAHLSEMRKKLNKIINSQYPFDPDLAENHEKLVAKARKYLREIDSIDRLFLGFNLDVSLVSLDKFRRISKEADWLHVEHWGQFSKVFLIQNFPNEKRWIVHLFPVGNLRGGKDPID